MQSVHQADRKHNARGYFSRQDLINSGSSDSDRQERDAAMPHPSQPQKGGFILHEQNTPSEMKSQN
jgi:hypothetical protein